jgi:hypothetical protein
VAATSAQIDVPVDQFREVDSRGVAD